MSYISGNANTLEYRLHQLPTGCGDTIEFYREALGYASLFTNSQKVKINKELNKKYLGGNYGFELGRSVFDNARNPVSQFSLINQTEIGDGNVFGDNWPLYGESGVLYFSDGGTGLLILNSNNPNSLSLITGIDWPSQISSLAYRSGYLYGFAVDSNVYTVDVRNTSSPAIIHTIPPVDDPAIYVNPKPPKIQDNNIYIVGHYGGGGNSGWIFSYDITNPEIPVRNFVRYPDNSWGGGDCVPVKDYLYVCDYFSRTDDLGYARFLVYNISNPNNLIYIKEARMPLDMDAVFEPWQVHYYNGFLYFKDDFLTQIWSIKEPENPIYITGYVGGADTEGSVISNNILFDSVNGGTVIDIASLENPSFPKITSGFITADGASHMFSADDSRNLLFGTVGGKLAIFQYSI